MKYVILFLTCLVLSTSAFSQVGIGTITPNASAALDLTSTTKGLLPPRMTAAQRNAIATPAPGLMVYCTNCGPNGEAQMYNGIAWVNLVGGTATFGCGDNFTVSGVTYGTVIGASKCWLDRNLGASQVAGSSTDAASYGDLYQWGRGSDGHQIRSPSTTTSTLSTTDEPAHGNFILAPNSPYDWRSGQNDNLWQGVNGINNPCPTGYRIPTEAEWDAERVSWSPQNNSTGAWASPLKLPVAGFRSLISGLESQVNSVGRYWSSTSTVSSTSSRYLFFRDVEALMESNNRANGYSVRCIYGLTL